MLNHIRAVVGWETIDGFAMVPVVFGGTSSHYRVQDERMRSVISFVSPVDLGWVVSVRH